MKTDATLSPADLLYGVKAIAAHLQMTVKQVYHLHAKGDLPTFKIGATVCARRSTLAKHFADQEFGPSESNA
ncbi:hypothetical protein [Sphingomonas sp.]|uniref:hypothetical protein n=1 Tax=Sphingomonas sp. TaxID=28214 RepID=UPI00257EA418|nr:hypothetical protein [Sphingomonas sp.]